MSLTPHPNDSPSDLKNKETRFPAPTPTFPMDPTPISPMEMSDETEPFEENEVANTPVVSSTIPTLLRPPSSGTNEDSSDSESSNFVSPLPPLSQLSLVPRRGSATIHYTRKRLRAPTAPIHPPSSTIPMMLPSPPLFPRCPLPPPTTFFYQTTTVPLSPPTSPPRAHSNPISPSERTHSSIPLFPTPHATDMAETSQASARRRVNARLRSFLLAHMNKDRIDEITDLINENPLERIMSLEAEVGDLEMGRIEVDEFLNLMGTQLQKTLELVTELERELEKERQEVQGLRDIATIMQDVNEIQAAELVTINTRILTLERMTEESQARERVRDQEMEELTKIVKDLRRKQGDAPDDS